MAEQKNLSLCIITKNEEAFFPGCINSMEATVDEIMVADLGSIDSTPELARQSGAAVYQPEWEDDFGKIKNFCMDHATGKWVLFLQADEIISHEQQKMLKLLLHNPTAEGYLFDFGNKQEIKAAACPAQALRLVRNRKNYRFCYRSFEYIPDEALYSILNSGINITQCNNKTAGWQEEERSRLLQKDIREHPRDGYLRYLEGIRLMNQQKFKESAASFELALHAFAGGYLYTPHLYKCLGACLLELSRYKAAEEVLSEGAWLFPFYTDLLVLRADLYRRLGRDADAQKDLENCLIMLNTPNACVPVPETGILVIVKLLDEFHDGKHNLVNV